MTLHSGIKVVSVSLKQNNMGIGAALAVDYAAPNMVLGLLARNEDRLNSIAKICGERGAKCHIMQVDISNIEELERALNSFDQCYPIDLFFANAGQVGVTRDDSGTVEWVDGWRRLFEVNYSGNVASIITVYKRMKERKDGQIAVISSITGYFGSPNMCWYNSTKAALSSFTRDLRDIAQAESIKVSLIVPGMISTGMTLDPRQPMPLSISFFANPQRLAYIIRKGLKKNLPCIGWPYNQMLSLFVVSTMPHRIILILSWILGKMFQLLANDPALT
ncbi:hypothetical protein G9A89_003505 [Geosiphon pyriformis]|nr:hypothetical protein G9A89_003505 [Geosiphon pyriformis]